MFLFSFSRSKASTNFSFLLRRADKSSDTSKRSPTLSLMPNYQLILLRLPERGLINQCSVQAKASIYQVHWKEAGSGAEVRPREGRQISIH